MKAGASGEHLAVLIDADNISSKVVTGLMAEIANYGTASVRRIYGDWTSPLMKGWRECLLEHSIVPIQQFAYTTGKNATDGAMIIDAMDLLYTGRFASFCLVSSDSDFTRLAARIREQGTFVYGFGNRHNTHRAFIAACNEFIYLDALPVQSDETGEPAPSPQTPPNPTVSRPPTHEVLSWRSYPPPTGPRAHEQAAPGSHQLLTSKKPTQRTLDQWALDGLRKAINSSSLYEEDFVNLAEVGHLLVKISPDLNPRNYGFLRLKDFVEASGIVQLKMKALDGAPPIALVRLKGQRKDAV